jgi:hypothetical protein
MKYGTFEIYPDIYDLIRSMTYYGDTFGILELLYSASNRHGRKLVTFTTLEKAAIPDSEETLLDETANPNEQYVLDRGDQIGTSNSSCYIFYVNEIVCGSKGTYMHVLASNSTEDVNTLLITMDFLLSHGAKADVEDDNGKTPLDIARSSSNKELFKGLTRLINDHKEKARAREEMR